MSQQLQGIIVAVIVLAAVAWLIYRGKKMKSDPCGSCKGCTGIDLSQAAKNDSLPPPASQTTDDKKSDPVPQTDSGSHT